MDQSSKSEKTLNEEIEAVRQRPSRTGFFISDVPLHVYKEFIDDVKVKYNDIYWVKLMDLMRKAESYDILMSNSEEYIEQKPIEEVKDRTGVKTFGGII